MESGRRARTTVVAAAVLLSAASLLAAAPAMAAPAAIKLTSASCPTEILQGQSSGCVTELKNLLNATAPG
ncbi:hypothetical protein [Streptomyces sp. NPDC002580]|uniref:hypothetical protein n=1 Tax=Streptomyces sp. NPDC002580 TaxID=3364653 RepID=UPI00369047B3